MNQSRHLCGYVISVLNKKLIKLSNIRKYCCSGPFEISVTAGAWTTLRNRMLSLPLPCSRFKG